MDNTTIQKFLDEHDYDIRKTHNGRWIDQKCTMDVVCLVSDCIVEYTSNREDKRFTVNDIWYSDYTVENVQQIFSKPNPTQKASNEYDKYFGQPIKTLRQEESGLDLLMDLGKVSKTEHKVNNEHVPSTIQPDTLFTFTTEFKWLISMLKNKMISPRYCSEDIEYLKIDGIKKIAYPMRCFCDINLQKLDYHMSWYGNYGIAFEKSWGMQNNIQPVHYLNENSTLRKDISDTFQRILKEDDKEETETQIMLKDYLLHELMFKMCKINNIFFIAKNTVFQKKH